MELSEAFLMDSKKMLKEKGFDKSQPTLKSFLISHCIYGINIMSLFELAKDYTRPLVCIANSVLFLTLKIQENVNAKRKRAIIVQPKSVSNISITVGDMVETYAKSTFEKRRNWDINNAPVGQSSDIFSDVKWLTHIYATKPNMRRIGSSELIVYR